MTITVSAFGKNIQFPDGTAPEDIEKHIGDNMHILNPTLGNKAKRFGKEFAQNSLGVDMGINTSGQPTGQDYLKGFASGANKLVSGAGYLAELAGAEETGKSIREFGDRGAAYWNNKMSGGGRKAAETPVFEDDPESITGIRLTDDWGNALLMGAAQSTPTMFAAAIPGSLAAKGIQKLASLGLAGGTGATIPLLAGTAAPVGVTSNLIARAPAAAGFGAAEGVTSGAINAAEFKSSIEEMGFDELGKSPVFQALAEQHGPDKARTIIAEQAASDVFGRTAVSTGTIGALTGGGALGQAYQKVTGAAKGGLLNQTAKGAAQEALQEAPQSGGEKLIENIATRDYLDPSQNVMEGVIADAASGAAIGGLMGGVVGAGGSVNVTRSVQDKAARINQERERLGLQKIATAESVDEVIQAASEAVAQKPVTAGDIFDDAAARDELLRRAEQINQPEVAQNEAQTTITEAPEAETGVLNQQITPQSPEAAQNQSLADDSSISEQPVANQSNNALASDIVAQNLSDKENAIVSPSRSPEERLKDRDSTIRLERALRNAGHEYKITPMDVRDMVALGGRTEQEAKQAENIAREFGKRVVWITADGPEKINGVVNSGIKDTIFVDVRSSNSAHTIVGHELSHHMENDAPQAYADMVESLKPFISGHQEYRAKYNIPEGMDIDNVTKEMVGDVVGDNFNKPKFWKQVAEYNPSSFKRIADSVITWLKKLATKAKMRGLGSEQWVSDIQKTQDIVAKAVAQYKDISVYKPTKSEKLKFALALRKDGYKTIRDFVIPETPEYADNNTGDLAHVPDNNRIPSAPIRVEIGMVAGAHRGRGLMHIADNVKNDASRLPKKYTGDRAEDIMRNVLDVIRGVKKVYKDGPTSYIFVNPSNNRSLVTNFQNGYYSVITDRPSVANNSVKSEWSGRLTLPHLDDSASSPLIASHQSIESPNSDRHGLKGTSREKVIIPTDGDRSQVKKTVVRVKKKRNIESKFSFAGEKSQTANKYSLTTARQRLESGEDAEKVRQETGWHKGVDGKFRYEIDDSEAKLMPAIKTLDRGGYEGDAVKKVVYRRNDDGTFSFNLIPENPKKTSDIISIESVAPSVAYEILPSQVINSIRDNKGDDSFIGANLDDAKELNVNFTFDGMNALPLEYVLDHERLFAAYPALRDISVQVDPKIGTGGSFGVDKSDGVPVITVGKSKQLSTLLHEIQHGIQNIEGFAAGGSPDASSDNIVDSKSKANDINKKYEKQKNDIRNSEAYKKHVEERFKLTPKNSYPTNRNGEKSEILARKNIENKVDEKFGINALEEKRKADVERILNLSPYDTYNRLAGEIEARNVQFRQKFNEDQRRETSPEASADIPAEEAIVIYNGNVMDNAPAPANSVAEIPDTITIDGKGRPTRNSEGKLIHPTEEGIKNFWEWFGESKVVDNQGRPLVVYHGTQEEFDAFDPDMRGNNFGDAASYAGFFFASNKSIATYYSSGDHDKVMDVYLKSDNPLVVSIEKEIEDNYNPSSGLSFEEFRGAVQSEDNNFDGAYGWAEQSFSYYLDSAIDDGNTSVIFDFGNLMNVRFRNLDKILVVFDPAQIKSATDNTGKFSAKNDDIRFSRSETLSQAGVATEPKEEASNLPEETKLQAFRRRSQDTMLRFKVVQKWLDEQGVKLSEAANVYQRENISKGKAANKVEDFRRDQLEPLIKRIAETSKKADTSGKFDLGDVVTYLEAVHIPEANKRMRLIHKDDKATANGITDDQAREVIAQFEAMPNFSEFKKLAEEVRNIGSETLDMLLDAGVVSREKYDAYKATFKNYVPLRGNATKQGFGKGLSTNAKDKRRMGHGFREDEFVLENLLQMREMAIMQIEKNKVGMSVAQFLMEAENPNIGTVDTPEKMRVMKDFSYAVTFKGRVVGSFETEAGARNAINRITEKPGDLIPDGESFTQTDFAVEKNYDPHIVMMARPQLAENEIQVYVNGHAVKLQLNDPGLARAATNAGIEQVGSIIHGARMFNRFLSKAYTAWSPDFLFMNMARDAYSGTLVLTGKKGAAFAAKTFTNYGTAIKELVKGRKDPKKSKLVERYREAGGNIGAAYLSDIERVGEDAVAALQEFAGARETYRMEYNAQISKGSSEKKARTMAALKAGVAKTKAMPVVGHLFQTIERVNMVIENALRLATFKTAIEQGESDQQAAMLSKDLMNFNRKGEVANMMGAAYLFYNPGMQGAHIVGEALFTSKHKKQVWALLGALTSMSFMLAELARGGGDDDDEREWENVPDYIKDRNLIFNVGDGQVTVPVAYGFGIFHAFGNYLSDLNHGADMNEIAVKLASGVFENFSVFGNPILDDDRGSEIRIDQILPTLPKLMMGPGINMDSLGRQIQPVKAQWNESVPDSQNMFRSVRGTAYEDVAHFMNDITGGNKYNPGAVDISPNTIKYWVTSLTGGAGRFISDVTTGAAGAAEGVAPELENVPVLRKFFRQPGVTDSRASFYKAKREVDAASQRYKKAMKDGDAFNSQKMLEENQEIIWLLKFAGDSALTASAKRDWVLDIQQDKSLSKADKKLKIKEIELQEQRVYDDFLRSFDEAKGKMKK